MLLALALALTTTPAFAQGAGSTTSLSGVVQDTDGGAVPGASVKLTNTATNATAADLCGATSPWRDSNSRPGG